MQKITTFLTFDDQAEDAIDLCTSIFPDSRIVTTTRSPGGPLPKGSLLSATFELAGQRFMALNGGPSFEFASARHHPLAGARIPLSAPLERPAGKSSAMLRV
jgi:predicted 3-demethylubiquinone-9 3-methyltransferase (glyoxalase superfamily)